MWDHWGKCSSIAAPDYDYKVQCLVSLWLIIDRISPHFAGAPSFHWWNRTTRSSCTCRSSRMNHLRRRRFRRSKGSPSMLRVSLSLCLSRSLSLTFCLSLLIHSFWRVLYQPQIPFQNADRRWISVVRSPKSPTFHSSSSTLTTQNWTVCHRCCQCYR